MHSSFIVDKRMETTIVYKACVGVMEKKMETTIVYWGCVGVNGKEKGNYHSILGSQQRPPPMSRLHSTFLAGHTGQKHRTCVLGSRIVQPIAYPGSIFGGFPKIRGTILGGPN